MALTSFTGTNNNGDPVIQSVIDTGRFSAPVIRPTTYTPIGGYVVPTTFAGQSNFGATGNDYSVGSAPAKRPQVFEASSFSCTLDPGLIVNG